LTGSDLAGILSVLRLIFNDIWLANLLIRNDLLSSPTHWTLRLGFA